MKLDVSQVIKDLDGKPIKNGEQDATVKSIFTNALLAQEREDNPSGDEKMNRWLLAKKTKENDTVEYSVEELSKIKKLVGKLFTAQVVGPIYELIEQEK